MMKRDEAVIKNQTRVLSVDKIPLMRGGIVSFINAKPERAGNFHQIMTARA